MDSNYIFAQVEKLKEKAMTSMGKLSSKLKNEAQKIVQEKQVDKKDLSYIFKEIGQDIKEKIAKLANIGNKIKQLEEVARVNKRLQLKNLEIQIEVFESVAGDFGENVEDSLKDIIKIYEKVLDEKNTPAIFENTEFHKMIENIIRSTDNMIIHLEQEFDERLENKIKYGGTRPFYMGLKIIE